MKKYIIYGIILILLSSVLYIAYVVNSPYRQIESKIKGVQNEKELIKLLGNPYKVYLKGAKNYYIDGYSFKNKEIKNKVFIYLPENLTDTVADLILYVYIDENGLIEEYYVGGS